jgi:hypothetical protein
MTAGQILTSQKLSSMRSAAQLDTAPGAPACSRRSGFTALRGGWLEKQKAEIWKAEIPTRFASFCFLNFCFGFHLLFPASCYDAVQRRARQLSTAPSTRNKVKTE